MFSKFLKLTSISLLLSSYLFAENNVDSIVDIEVNKLNQMLKKEIELVNMIESYILLNPPTTTSGSETTFDPTIIKRKDIQGFYKLPNSYFNNYDDESCIVNGNFCDDNNSGGIGIVLKDDSIEITNLLGTNKKSDRNKQIFKRLHKKYKNIIFNSSYDLNGTITRRYSNKIDSLRTNINNYLMNPYNNYIISYKKPVNSYNVWIKPDGEGSFYTYTYDSTTTSWKQIGKNIITKFPTYANYLDLQNVNSFDGAIMYARYSNKESNYAKYGEMEFINTGKSLYYPTSTKERWSIKAGNNIFIKDQVTISNTCSEIKNPLIGIDSNDRYIYANSSGSGQKVEEKLSIDSKSTYTTINAEQLFYFFRNKYEFKIDPNAVNSKTIKLDYENLNDYKDWQVKKMLKTEKQIKNNMLSFEVFNKINTNLDNIENITINKVRFWHPTTHSWIEKTPISNVINGSNLRNIQLKFSVDDQNDLDNMFVSKYKANVLNSGEILRTMATPITFNTSNTDLFYGDLDTGTFDGNIDTIQGYPIIVDFSIKVSSLCNNGRNYHDCYLVETSNSGCYISSLKSITE